MEEVRLDTSESSPFVLEQGSRSMASGRLWKGRMWGTWGPMLLISGCGEPALRTGACGEPMLLTGEYGEQGSALKTGESTEDWGYLGGLYYGQANMGGWGLCSKQVRA